MPKRFGKDRDVSDYYVHRLQVSMPLASAERIADEVIAAGHDVKLLPLTVAVLDAGGNLVVLKREDGSGILRADIAIGKAWGALGMGIPAVPSATACASGRPSRARSRRRRMDDLFRSPAACWC